MVRKLSEKQADEDSLKRFVVAWNKKGYKPEELKALVDIVFDLSPQLSLTPNLSLLSPVDMCGTGGDKANTFNISTLAAVVAAGCGVPIIKHSGRSTTSISGSVDILNEFGFDVNVSADISEKCFLKTNLMFVSSKILRETFGIVKKICKEINAAGFVNLLGPLVNPYKTEYQLLGVSSKEWGKVMSSVLKLQDKKEALIVCCKIKEPECFLDELSLCGVNYLWHLKDGQITEKQITAKDMGEIECLYDDLIVSNITESKQIFESVLKGTLEPKAKTVALNAGAVLYLQKKVKFLQDGYYIALKAINSGLMWEHFEKFLNCNKMSLEKGS